MIQIILINNRTLSLQRSGIFVENKKYSRTPTLEKWNVNVFSIATGFSSWKADTGVSALADKKSWLLKKILIYNS